jgi:hypothetical protein
VLFQTPSVEIGFPIVARARTVTDINPPDNGDLMAGTRVTVTLPAWVVERLEVEVRKGRFTSIEDAVMVGAKLVAGLGPRARELLREGAGADEFVRSGDSGDKGDWL